MVKRKGCAPLSLIPIIIGLLWSAIFDHENQGGTPMSISVIGQNPATEGRTVFTPGIIGTKQTKKTEENAKQAETVVENVSKIKADVQQLQDISDILGRKLLFNVNEQLDKVVVKVVDPSTDKVIKEIPSAEVQQMQIRIREALGFLFDEKI